METIHGYRGCEADRRGRMLASALGWLVGFGLVAAPVLAVEPPKPTPELLTKGKELFKKECSVCHGAEGKGDGPAAYLLFPAPRDFTRGVFKLRSTPSGEPPLASDILRTITEGVPGSAMPGFPQLSEQDRWALVYHLKKVGNLGEPEKAVTVKGVPPATPKRIARGKALYKDLKCWECHGEKGVGDGPSALTTKDDWGFPNPPNNFPQGVFKGGARPNDIYLRFTTGMDGSAMPSYEDSVGPDDRWSLVHYVKSLSGRRVVRQPGAGTIQAVRVKKLPAGPEDPGWAKVKPSSVPLMVLWQRIQWSHAVQVKAAHDGERIAFLLAWEDETPGARPLKHHEFADAAALQFVLKPRKGGEGPQFTMGDEDSLVNIWYWRADREKAGQGSGRNVRGAGGGARHSLVVPVAAATDGRGPVSRPDRTPPIEDLNALGFGTVTPQSAAEQNVEGRSVRRGKGWAVFFTRTLDGEGPLDVRLAPGGSFPVAFAVWDGGLSDRDGQKAVSTWYTLRFEK